MTKISAAKIICIHNKLIKVNPHTTRLISEATFFSCLTSFVSLTFSLADRLRLQLCFRTIEMPPASQTFCSQKVFLLCDSDTPRCLYIITLHLSDIGNQDCHNNWAIIPDPTTIEHGRENWHEMNRTIVMETFDWRPPKLSFRKWKKIVGGRVWLVTAVKRALQLSELWKEYTLYKGQCCLFLYWVLAPFG